MCHGKSYKNGYLRLYDIEKSVKVKKISLLNCQENGSIHVGKIHEQIMKFTTEGN